MRALGARCCSDDDLGGKDMALLLSLQMHKLLSHPVIRIVKLISVINLTFKQLWWVFKFWCTVYEKHIIYNRKR